MAFENIFDKLRTRRVTLQVQSGAAARTLLVIDCTPVERFSLASQATLHEIEDGSEISDHVIKRGRTLSIEGIVSDSPINLTQVVVGNAAGLLGGAIGGAGGVLATAATVVMANLALAGSAKPSKAALDIFEEIYRSSALLTIIGGLTTYTDMVMENFDVDRSARTGGGLFFKGAFRQISIAIGQSVDIPEAARSAGVKDLSAVQKQAGRKQGSILDGGKQGKAASWAYRLVFGDK
jgi:hypothetical protein